MECPTKIVILPYISTVTVTLSVSAVDDCRCIGEHNCRPLIYDNAIPFIGEKTYERTPHRHPQRPHRGKPLHNTLVRYFGGGDPGMARELRFESHRAGDRRERNGIKADDSCSRNLQFSRNVCKAHSHAHRPYGRVGRLAVIHDRHYLREGGLFTV